MTSPTHDPLGRRRRDRPASTGKRVTPQPRDVLWFQKLHEHGPLSSSYLHAFSQHLARSEKRARDRLTDLFNERNTPHGGAYLTRPWQQFQTLDARYQELVYDLAPSAEQALQEHGLWREQGASAGGPWRHRHMVAAITASIELATLSDSSLGYVPQYAILTRAGTTMRHPVPITNPATGKEERHDLIPDALFGLEYKQSGGSRFRFFAVEADRGTEPSRASVFNRKSHLRSFLQYRAYIGRGLYRDHLKLTGPLLLLNVATSLAAMERMIDVALKLAPEGNTYQLFTCCPEFGTYFKPRKPALELLHAPWSRAGYPAFCIDGV